jgi:integrase
LKPTNSVGTSVGTLGRRIEGAAAMPLTDTAIKNAKKRATAYKLTDEKGLFLLIHPNGSKYWRLSYRFGGKQKTLALGVYGEVSLKEARDARGKARALLKAGKDPAIERKTDKIIQRGENSFEAVAREFAAKQGNKWSAKHHANFLRRLDAGILPDLGGRPIAEIEASELLSVLRKTEARKTYDFAHRLAQMCGAVFRYGIATGRCKHDIAADLRGALTPHKAGHMAAIKPEDLPELLTKIEDYQGELQTRLAMKFLALSFVRTGELIGAEWSEFDFEKALWTIPAPRMKMKAEHLVPLSRQALAILEELHSLNGSHRYVLVGRNSQKLMSCNTILYALYRLGYKGRMTGHGFRSVGSTALNEARNPSGQRLFHEDWIECQLAHKERNRIRAAYNRSKYLPERREMMQWWADHLDRLQGGNVITMRFGGAV